MAANHILAANHIVDVFLSFQQQIQLYHWSTKVFARHSASDKLYKDFSELLDRFVETLQGHFEMSYARKKIEVGKLSDDRAIPYLKGMADFLTNDLSKFFAEQPRPQEMSDLATIRDEMLASVRRSIYLFTLQ